LKIQFAVVAIALAGARIASGVISAGYSQVMPNHPTAKKELKTNRKTAAAIPALLFASLYAVVVARTIIEADIPMAPRSMSLRRPILSMVNTATHEAMKYSVPFRAASSRLMKGDKPMRRNIVAA
jgi:hypothetical protein